MCVAHYAAVTWRIGEEETIGSEVYQLHNEGHLSEI